MLDLDKLTDLEKDERNQEKKCMWHLIETSGKDIPGKISHHTCSVYGDKMYLIGGTLQSGEPNTKIYSLDLRLFKWDAINGVT